MNTFLGLLKAFKFVVVIFPRILSQEYTDENVLLVLCGNKIDLDHRRKVKEERAMKLAKVKFILGLLLFYLKQLSTN